MFLVLHSTILRLCLKKTRDEALEGDNIWDLSEELSVTKAGGRVDSEDVTVIWSGHSTDNN